MQKTIWVAILLSLSSLGWADINTAQQNLAKNYPNLEINNIASTEMRGIYSAELDGQVVYLNEDAQHLIAGNMLRLSDQKSLTQELIVKKNTIDWKKLPLKNAIKSVRGNGKRQLAIFSDPNCPYCKQLEVELKKLNDVTIYTFILPLKSQSVAASKQVYCEQDPAYAWQQLIEKGIEPKTKKSCTNPVNANLALAKELGIAGTPAIIFSNGYRVLGAYPANEMEAIWRELGL
ncbi:DsbC family protein [uncultured Acinetobacter sp.]|uniref:DsbC family protein n=1 Tax=uncultured Acinetobacter sp. TaxID=165433 RepID=UPI002626D1F9|nr:DsbC family protein [uncultured Acinetobacter sp.]